MTPARMSIAEAAASYGLAERDLRRELALRGRVQIGDVVIVYPAPEVIEPGSASTGDSTEPEEAAP